MVAGDGEWPGAGLREELLEELGGVAGVGSGVERIFERGEGGGVVHEVDLHAADIDGAGTTGLVGLNGGDGLLLGVENLADALDIDGPGPGHDAAALAPSAFHDGDGLHQPVRHAKGAFGLGDRLATWLGLRRWQLGLQLGLELGLDLGLDLGWSLGRGLRLGAGDRVGAEEGKKGRDEQLAAHERHSGTAELTNRSRDDAAVQKTC